MYKIDDNNKDILHSTWRHIQYLLITYHGKESEKNTCISIYNVVLVLDVICFSKVSANFETN